MNRQGQKRIWHKLITLVVIAAMVCPGASMGVGQDVSTGDICPASQNAQRFNMRCRVYLMMAYTIKFFYRYLAIFKNCFKGFTFDYLFRMMWDGSLTAIGISTPDFMSILPLAIEMKPEFPYNIGYFSICDSRKMFSHDRCLYRYRYWDLKRKIVFAFKDDRWQEFAVVFSALNMDSNHILYVINNLGISLPFSVTALQCRTLCKISSFFTRFYYYWEKIYLLHNFILQLLVYIYRLIYNSENVKGLVTDKFAALGG